jgi:hypothetical protein
MQKLDNSMRVMNVTGYHNFHLLSVEKNEMGGACGAYGGEERCAQGSGGET